MNMLDVGGFCSVCALCSIVVFVYNRDHSSLRNKQTEKLGFLVFHTSFDKFLSS